MSASCPSSTALSLTGPSGTSLAKIAAPVESRRRQSQGASPSTPIDLWSVLPLPGFQGGSPQILLVAQTENAQIQTHEIWERKKQNRVW